MGNWAVAWGIMVLIWQDGYGSRVIWGIQAAGATVTVSPSPSQSGCRQLFLEGAEASVPLS